MSRGADFFGLPSYIIYVRMATGNPRFSKFQFSEREAGEIFISCSQKANRANVEFIESLREPKIKN